VLQLLHSWQQSLYATSVRVQCLLSGKQHHSFYQGVKNPHRQQNYTSVYKACGEVLDNLSDTAVIFHSCVTKADSPHAERAKTLAYPPGFHHSHLQQIRGKLVICGALGNVPCAAVCCDMTLARTRVD